MKKTGTVLMVYLLGMVLVYWLFKWWGIDDWGYVVEQKITIKGLFVVAVVGGIIAMKYILSPAAYRIFLAGYIGLWVLRIVFLFAANRVAPIQLGNKQFDFFAIISNFFTYVFRLDGPLPFMIFLFADYLFSGHKKRDKLLP